MSDPTNFENEKFMYEKVYDELNRSRDWPFKIMAFASAIYLALIGLMQIDEVKFEFTCLIKAIIVFIITVFSFWTICIIVRQHLNYIDYRNIQKKLQIKMKIFEWKIDESKIFPDHWKKEFEQSIFTGFQGWGFYAFYIIALYAISVILIVNK